MMHVIAVSSCEVADACKILENTYQASHIATISATTVKRLTPKPRNSNCQQCIYNAEIGRLLCYRLGIDAWEGHRCGENEAFRITDEQK